MSQSKQHTSKGSLAAVMVHSEHTPLPFCFPVSTHHFLAVLPETTPKCYWCENPRFKVCLRTIKHEKVNCRESGHPAQEAVGGSLDKAIYLSSRRLGIQKDYFIVKNRSGKKELCFLYCTLFLYLTFHS